MKLWKVIIVLINASLLLLNNLLMASPLNDYSDNIIEVPDNDEFMYVVGDYLAKEIGYDDDLAFYPSLQKRKPSVFKYLKSCVPRGGNCDHRRKSCCNNGSCRCNLWGGNCKCQRMGFFQKWGK
ncbi:uncharacterized protein LOC126898119 [Daktulosphaira vitifoliae]|uniref:uncharacterized protein LOC126898119 n=1 Tax=Daktulosphaira vitifoliae TaxID=58002 RepID=UPI0021AA3AB7|nr:uncharacterized protein LOC126898119 [Daktulosphaira vitifoliae]